MTVEADKARKILVNSLKRRTPTWVVAHSIRQLGILKPGTALYKDVSELSIKKTWREGQMSDEFYQAVPADTQLATFKQLFPTVDTSNVESLSIEDASYVTAHRSLIREGLALLGVPETFTATDALKDRYTLNWNAGVASSKKAFTKRVRFLNSYEERITRVADTKQLHNALHQSKSRLAYMVDASQLDDVSLAFIAYLAARANRRSLFMLGGQSKAFDNVSDGLQEMLDENSAWEQIAYVSPTTNVFKHLNQETLGKLSGLFHREMVTSANALRDLYPHLPARMREEMVMVKGVDSSRWNAYAGAYNNMRSAWISATLASGLGEIFDSYLPGKVGRLMASDLVWWARNEGEELHEDTRMFNALPFPWEVTSGEVTLTRSDILAVAEKEKVVDAVKSGWVGPRIGVESEIASAEPATVHGVVVSDPSLAVVLRKAGVFSSKKLRNIEGLPPVLPRCEVTDGERVIPVVGLPSK